MNRFIRTVSTFVRAPIASLKDWIGERALAALDLSRDDMINLMEVRVNDLAGDVDMHDLAEAAIDSRTVEEQLVDNYQFDDDAITEAVAERIASDLDEDSITEAVAQSFTDSIDRRDVVDAIRDQVSNLIDDTDAIVEQVAARVCEMLATDDKVAQAIVDRVAQAMIAAAQPNTAKAAATSTEEGR